MKDWFIDNFELIGVAFLIIIVLIGGAGIVITLSNHSNAMNSKCKIEYDSLKPGDKLSYDCFKYLNMNKDSTIIMPMIISR